MSSVLALALPCRQCPAKSGEACVRRDGEPAYRSHMNRTPAAPCGTYGGYQRHVKAGETACEECLDASRRYMAERRRNRPDEYAKDLAGLKATNRATKRLVDRHRDEWKALVAEEKAR